MDKKVKKVKVAFDIGGVLSKFPDIFRPIFNALQNDPNIEVYVLTDMHLPEQSMKMLEMNGFHLKNPKNLINSDFKTYGEYCKAHNCYEHQMDVHIDDFPAYVAEGATVRLLMMPDVSNPYYADSWKTDGTEGDFGRRKKADMPPQEQCKTMGFCYECLATLDAEGNCPTKGCKGY